MIESGDGAQKLSLEEAAKSYIGDRGMPEDAWNNFMGTQLNLQKNDWQYVESPGTFEEYCRHKFVGNDPAAIEVIKQSDPELVRRFNEVSQKIKAEIGTGVRSDEQVTKIKDLLDEAREVVYGHR